MKPFYLPLFLLITTVLFGCAASQPTLVKHGGEFSNVRATIRLQNGGSLFGYARLNLPSGNRNISLWVPGERGERSIKLDEIKSITIEEEVFEVRWLSNPSASVREGKPRHVQAVVKRLSNEGDPIEVFEYKYKVRNPKSHIGNTQTAWFVSFPSDEKQRPMCEIGSSCYKEKWAAIAMLQPNGSGVSKNPPASVKNLLQQVDKIQIAATGQNNAFAVGN